MGIGRQLTPFDTRIVGLYLLRVCGLAGAVMLVPTAVALIAWELPQVAWLGATAAGCLLVGWIGRRRTPRHLGFADALAVTAIGYLLVAALGAVPYLAVAPPVDAFFESMSGYTTTGLTVLVPERLPESLLFYRSWTQWVGGAAILVLSLLVLKVTGASAVELYRSELGRQELADSLRTTTRFALTVYSGLTALGLVTLLVAGVPAFDALVHVLSTVSTGGFAARSDGVASLATPWALLPLMALMVLGATSFPVLWRARSSGPRAILRDPQVRHFAALALGAMVLFGALGAAHGGTEHGVFHAVSALTTTGFATEEPARWTDTERLGAIFLMTVGGAAGSTAGGVKIWRLFVVLKLVGWLVHRTLLPREASSHAAGAPRACAETRPPVRNSPHRAGTCRRRAAPLRVLGTRGHPASRGPRGERAAPGRANVAIDPGAGGGKAREFGMARGLLMDGRRRQTA